MMDFSKYIRNIPDFPKPGILFKDITPLLADPDAFHAAIHQLMLHYEHQPIDAISAEVFRAAPLSASGVPVLILCSTIGSLRT